MPLLEFFSEEIPARMQARAAEDLKKLVTDKLVAAGLTYDGAKAFATPRRLALAVAGIPVRQPDIKDERKGPRVGAPEQAIAGFLRARGLTSIDQAKVQPDKKGDFYVAVIDKPGRPAIEVIAGIVPEVAKAFPWPKAMRWGEGRPSPARSTGCGRCIPSSRRSARRPRSPTSCRSRSATSSRATRPTATFLSPAPIKVKRLDDYMAKLDAAKVVVDPARRAQMILADAKTLAFAQGFELVEDEGLLAEVAGLVEWPVVLMGSFDKAFLAIPEEVIRATIRNNQKCFVVRDPKTAKLTNKFILVSNIEASDGGSAIVAGNERVIRARLSTRSSSTTPISRPGWKTGCRSSRTSCSRMIRHSRPSVSRVWLLAGRSRSHRRRRCGQGRARRAALQGRPATEVVGDFPEVQGPDGEVLRGAGRGRSGRGTPPGASGAAWPDDLVPADPVSQPWLWPTSSTFWRAFFGDLPDAYRCKDPYLLRRAALGVVRRAIRSNRCLTRNPCIGDRSTGSSSRGRELV